MKNCVRETKAVACFLDPLLTGEIDPWSHLSTFNESRLVDTLCRNKVALQFERKLEMDPALKERIFSAFPNIPLLYHNLKIKVEKGSFAFTEIRNKFYKHGIEILLIKSDGSFPYESDNLDVLIKPDELGKVAKLLREAGYFELSQARELNKFLFRNVHTPEVLPLHIHTRVEWEGTQFADSASLWRRCKVSFDSKFLVPSPEDCILITAAHLFFEDHEVKLADLFKITSMLGNHSINWDYMIDHARKIHWDDTFCLIMLLVNLVHEDLFGRSMLQRTVLSRLEETRYGYVNLLRKTMKQFNSGCVPLNIPYAIAVLFFLRRVLSESSLSLAGRFKHADWIASNVLRERIVR